MISATVDEATQELAALKQTWETLAPNIEQARQIRQHAAANPALLSEGRSDALVRWLDTFERDIIALETLITAAESPGVQLSVDEIRLARRASEKLLATLQREREQSGAGLRAAAG